MAGGWGVVSKQCEDEYCFNCLLIIGDGSTASWLADVDIHITFPTTAFTANNQSAILVKNNAHLRCGVLVNATNKTGNRGVSLTIRAGYPTWLRGINIRGDSGSEICLYSCKITKTGYFGTYSFSGQMRMYGTAKLYQCNFDYMRIFLYSGSDVDISSGENKNNGGLIPYGGTATIDKYSHYDTNYGLWFYYYYAGDASNLFFRGSTTPIVAYQISADHNLIDCDIDNWQFSFSGADLGGKIYRQYTFDLKIVDKDGVVISGATVTLYDKDDNQIFQVTTAADGTITQQTITRGYYDQAHGDTLQECSPHRLTIEKAGYETYDTKFTLEEKVDWIIGLLDEIPATAPIGGAHAEPSEEKRRIPITIVTVDGHLLLNINRKKHDYILVI